MQNVMTFNAVVQQVTMLGLIMLSVNMLKLVIVLNVGIHQVDMLSLMFNCSYVIMLNVIMLNVIMPNVIMLNVIMGMSLCGMSLCRMTLC
jgi:hypothetical protein